MSNEEYDYSEPWDLYSDEDKPWLDYDRLLRLREEMDTQAEMGDALGCWPPTISEHLQKAREERRREGLKTGRICQRCEENEVPGGDESGNSLCVDCMEEVRNKDS